MNLAKRTAAPAGGTDASASAGKSDPFGGAKPADTASKLAAVDAKIAPPADDKDNKGEEPALKDETTPAAEGAAPASDAKDGEQKEQKRREPEKINSRAAAFGDAPAARNNQVRILEYNFYT